jgi:hypothetical protein
LNLQRLNMKKPPALDAALATQLMEALRAAPQDAEAPESAGMPLLHAALNDPAVHSVVVAISKNGPAASLVQVIRKPDTLHQWVKLACI